MVQKEVKEINKQDYINVLNYEEQSVGRILTPNILFVNSPVIKNKKRYYKLILWFDYLSLQNRKQDFNYLTFYDLKFELAINYQQEIISLTGKEYFDTKKMNLVYDQYFHRMNDNNYITYLVDEKYIQQDANNKFIFNLWFKNTDNKSFSNNGGSGENRGIININLETKTNDQNIIEMPEMIGYVANDSWTKQTKQNYLLSSKKFIFKKNEIYYVNKNNLNPLNIEVVSRNEKPISIVTMGFLNSIMFDVENNLLNTTLDIEEVKLDFDKKYNKYCDVKEMKYILAQESDKNYSLYLLDQLGYDFETEKTIKTTDQTLIFNPNIDNIKITILLKLNNKIHNLDIDVKDDSPIFNNNFLNDEVKKYKTVNLYRKGIKTNNITFQEYLEKFEEIN